MKSFFIVLLLTATYLSLTPKPSGILFLAGNTTAHVICWGVLSAAMYLAFREAGCFRTMLIALFLYSCAIEVGQIFVIGRYFSWSDIVANGTGCLLIYLAVLAIEAKRVSKNNRGFVYNPVIKRPKATNKKIARNE